MRKRIERRLDSLKPDVFAIITMQDRDVFEVKMRNSSPFLVYGIYIGETLVLDKLLSGEERAIYISSENSHTNETSFISKNIIRIDEEYALSEKSNLLFIQLYDRDGNLWNLEFKNIFSLIDI